jgi:hypothetical protein
MLKAKEQTLTNNFCYVHVADMHRDFSTALFLYTMLGAVVCAPIPEFESRLSPDKVGEEICTFIFQWEI